VIWPLTIDIILILSDSCHQKDSIFIILQSSLD